MIRVAQEDDIELMMTIERAADAVFRDVGMAAIADAEPMPADDLRGYQRSGRAWFDTDDLGQVVAYLLLDVLDGVPHIEQVSVHQSHAGRGKGRQLIEAVPVSQLSPGLRQVREHEAAEGLDEWPRIAMRRALTG